MLDILISVNHLLRLLTVSRLLWLPSVTNPHGSATDQQLAAHAPQPTPGIVNHISDITHK